MIMNNYDDNKQLWWW